MSARSVVEKPAAAPTYSAPALEKGIDIIELLGREPFGLTITEIAQRLGRSISELFRVIVVLDRRGWLHKDDTSDRYRVTYRLLELAHRATPAQELTHVATPPMHVLAGAAMQSCHLVVANGRQGLIVARQESPGTAGFAVRLGTTIDLDTSCSGHILLAFASETARADLLGGPPSAAFAALLVQVRERGYEITPSSRMAGVTDLSCPIFGLDGHVVAALTIPFLAAIDDAPHLSLDETLALLKTTAAEISSIFGWYDRADAPPIPRLSVAPPPPRRRAKGG